METWKTNDTRFVQLVSSSERDDATYTRTTHILRKKMKEEPSNSLHDRREQRMATTYVGWSRILNWIISLSRLSLTVMAVQRSPTPPNATLLFLSPHSFIVSGACVRYRSSSLLPSPCLSDPIPFDSEPLRARCLAAFVSAFSSMSVFPALQ